MSLSRRLSYCFIAILISGFCTVRAQLENFSGRVDITVKDRGDKSPVPSAHAWFLDEGKGSCIQAESDGRGGFTIQLPPGYYDVFVGASSFAPYTKSIHVDRGKIMKLKVFLGVNIETTTAD